jgi:hypothetical protein
MAEDNNETEKTADNNEAAEKPTGTVKKAATKKKAAKKKVAKKAVASKKKAVAKKKVTPAASAPASTKSAPAPASSPKSSDVKPATATTVAAAASSLGGGAEKSSAPSTADKTVEAEKSEAVTKIEAIKQEPLEESSMSTESKSTGGFWVKVIFWLLIIILFFIYIRSLAKNPVPEAAVTEDATTSSHATASSSMNEQSPAVADEGAAETADSEGLTAKTDAAQPDSGDEAQSGMTQSTATADSGEPSSDTASNSAQTDAAAQELMREASEDEPAANPAESSAATAADSQNSSLDQHDESVAKILKEFDELREAARAEMDAIHNRIQAERELRDAIVAPPPAAYPPAWRSPNAGYGPYPAPSQYRPRY